MKRIPIYIVDGNGDLLTDESLVRNLVIDAQSSARFINDLDSWDFTRSISSYDLYAETRNDYRGNDYLVVGPAYTEDLWREAFLYKGVILPPPLPPIKGLNTYHHRVAIWEAVILDAVLQPDIYDKPEDDKELMQDLNTILKASRLDLRISNMIIQGKGTFQLTPQMVQTTLPTWEHAYVSREVARHFGKFSATFIGASGYIITVLEIDADAMRLFYLHTLANARAEERLNAIGEYIQANHDELNELDPALEEGYKRAKEKFENDICEKYYDGIGNLLRSACKLDKAVTVVFSTGALIAAFKSAAVGKFLLPYYFSWEGYKTLRDKNEKVQRLTMAATLQRHLAGHITAGGLETLQRDLASNDHKNKDSIETAITLYNINQYLGWYFYRNYYEILNDPVFGPVQDFFTGGRLSDYLTHLDSQGSIDKANCIQTQKPYLLTEFNFYGWHDYSWLVNKLTYAHLNVIVSPKKERYKLGETAKVTVDIKNIGDKKNFWLGVWFKDPTEESTKYDPQIIITPQSASIDPCETKTFTVDWTIPNDAPLGQYEIAVNCWKDAGQNGKYTDDLEWVPIFNVDIAQPIFDFDALLALISDLFEALISALNEIVTSLKGKTISVPPEEKAIENVEGYLDALASMANTYSEFMKMIYELSEVEPSECPEVKFNYHVLSSKFFKTGDEAKTYMSSNGIDSRDMNDALELVRELELEKEGFCIVIVDYSYSGFGEYESGKYPIVCNEKGDPFWESWQFYENIKKEIEEAYKEYEGGT